MNNLARSISSVLLITACGSTSAADTDWQFEVSPYLWGVSQSGDTGIRNVKGTEFDLISELDMSFENIFKNLDSGFLINGLARKNDWLFAIDSIYMKVKVGKSSSGISGLADNSVNVTAKQQLIDMIAGYRLHDTKSHNFYLYAGARFADIENTINTNFTPLGIPELNNSRSISFGDNWVDPMIGGYSEYAFNNTFTLLSRLEVGGFGVGSDNSWLASLGLDHKLSDNWSLKYSYRFLSVDYGDNDFVFNIETNGLLIGATYKF